MRVEFTKTSALDPGYETNILTVVGAISGNWDVGKVFIAKPPVNNSTSEMTIAKTGL
jgi:hypothetical protein